MTTGEVNLTWARTLIDELWRCGVTMVCLAPGSRSTSLVLAAAEHPGLRVVTHLDERSAAFFALGVGKATRVPAVIITTAIILDTFDINPSPSPEIHNQKDPALPQEQVIAPQSAAGKAVSLIRIK